MSQAGTRADISWLLNYGFVPGDSSGALAAAEATSRLEAYAAANQKSDALPTPPVDPAVDAAAQKLVTAAAALEACGPHTHGAVRLLQRERACLLAAALPV